MTSNFKRRIVAVLVLSLALGRYLFKSIFFILWLLLVLLVLASLAHNLGFFDFGKFNLPLSKIEIGDGLTALGILFASYGVMSAWRRQKREELMLQSAEEIDFFFRDFVRTTNKMSAEVRVLDRYLKAVLKEPDGGDWIYSTSHILGLIPQIEAARISINEMAIRVHDLDAREALVVWSIPLAKMRFDRAIGALTQLSDISFLDLPLGMSSAEDLRNWILHIGIGRDVENEYEKFIERSSELTGQIAGDIGGIRAAIFGRYFPPTIAGAKSIFEIKEEESE